jgi:hypothetical protein
VPFCIDGGALTEFTLAFSGSRPIMGNDARLDRTATTKIADLSAARVEVPEDSREIVEALAAGRKPEVFVPEPSFRALFDGRTLSGWGASRGQHGRHQGPGARPFVQAGRLRML